jgi:hypothetical protein
VQPVSDPLHPESLRNHTSLKRLEGHIRKSLRRVWPKRRHTQFILVAFDPAVGDIGITFEGNLDHVEQALTAALRTVQDNRPDKAPKIAV